MEVNNRPMKREGRLEYFKSLNITEFTRKDYMEVFRDISTSTASRDLKEGVKIGIFEKTGDKRKTIYKLMKKK